MKKIKLTASIILFTCFISTIISAQTFKVGVGGGLTQILGPDSYTNETSKLGSGYSTEFNFGLTGKLDLPLIPLTPRVIILYHSLNGSGSYPLVAKKSLSSNPSVEYSQSILSFGVGAQFGILPIPLGIDPYLSLDLFLNKYGDSKRTFSDELFVPISSNQISGGSRFGLQVGVGAEITIIPTVNLDVSAGYNLFNIIGKKDAEETLSAATLDLFFIFNLN